MFLLQHWSCCSALYWTSKETKTNGRNKNRVTHAHPPLPSRVFRWPLYVMIHDRGKLILEESYICIYCNSLMFHHCILAKIKMLNADFVQILNISFSNSLDFQWGQSRIHDGLLENFTSIDFRSIDQWLRAIASAHASLIFVKDPRRLLVAMYSFSKSTAGCVCVCMHDYP